MEKLHFAKRSGSEETNANSRHQEVASKKSPAVHSVGKQNEEDEAKRNRELAIINC